ncbi:hypothetical protein D3C85_1047450 [compost metagenome]
MQTRPMWWTRLLSHHFMQAPDDRASRRRPYRHPQPESVDRHGVSGGGRVKIVQDARGQRRKGVVAPFASRRLDATTAVPIQRLQSGLQRRQRVRL